MVSFNIEEIQKLISENVKIALTKFMRDSTDRFEDVDHQIKTLDKRMTEKLSNLVPANKYESLTKLVKEQASKIDTLTNQIRELEGRQLLPMTVEVETGSDSSENIRKRNPVQLDLINLITTENKERDKRDKSLIIFGIQTSTKTNPADKLADDTKAINELLQKVQIEKEKVVKCFRIQSKI